MGKPKQGTSAEFKKLSIKINRYAQRIVASKTIIWPISTSSAKVETSKVDFYKLHNNIRKHFSKGNSEDVIRVRQQFIALIASAQEKYKYRCILLILALLSSLNLNKENDLFIKSFQSKFFYDRMKDVVNTIEGKYFKTFESSLGKLFEFLDYVDDQQVDTTIEAIHLPIITTSTAKQLLDANEHLRLLGGDGKQSLLAVDSVPILNHDVNNVVQF